MSLVIIILFPFLAGIYSWFNAKNPRVNTVSTFLAGVPLVITLSLISQFKFHQGVQIVNFIRFLPAYGINLNFAADGISLLMLLLTNLLIPLILFSSSLQKRERNHIYLALILFTQGALNGVFLSFNAIIFYIFWEIALIPVYFLILLWGDAHRQFITLKFFLITLLGSLSMMIAFIYIYHALPEPKSFDFNYLVGHNLPVSSQSWLFLMMFLGFAIKIPLFPFHSWQPETYKTAPYQGSMLLSGLMMKMGVYGIFRWLIPLLPLGVAHWQNWVIIISITGMVYASLIALKQTDLKNFIAFSSLAHACLMGAAAFTGITAAVQGVLFQSFSHGILVFGLFFVAMLIENRTATTDISKMGGFRHKAPVFAGFFLIISLGSVGLPLTSGFVGEFLMILGLYNIGFWYALTGGLTLILGAVYMLYVYQKINLGPESQTTFVELNLHEIAIFSVIMVVIFTLGLYAQPMLSLTDTSVNTILGHSLNFKLY